MTFASSDIGVVPGTELKRGKAMGQTGHKQGLGSHFALPGEPSVKGMKHQSAPNASQKVQAKENLPKALTRQIPVPLPSGLAFWY